MLPDYIEQLCEKWALVGSRVTCNPPPTDTDQDILVLFQPKQMDEAIDELDANKWVREGEYGSAAEFISYRRGEINLVLTDEEEWFDLFLKATELCTEANFLKKEDRIKCFDKVFGREEKKSKATSFQEMYQKLLQDKLAMQQANNQGAVASAVNAQASSFGGTFLASYSTNSWPSLFDFTSDSTTW